MQIVCERISKTGGQRVAGTRPAWWLGGEAVPGKAHRRLLPWGTSTLSLPLLQEGHPEPRE